MSRQLTSISWISAVLFTLIGALSALASDWPQVGGKSRDFRVETASLSAEWPESGPRVLWERELGAGYSGISVVGDRFFTMYREGEDEVVIAARIKDGETIWQHRRPAPFASYHRMEHGSGPHVTPTVVNGRVFTAGILGNLMAFDAESGELLWSKELISGLGGTQGSRGYCNSPIAYGNNLIVNVGGEGQAVVAFDQATGEVAWQRHDFDNGYSSFQLIEVGGQPQLVLLNRSDVYGLAPDTGELLWSHAHPVMNGLSISVPIYSPEDGLLFVSTAYNGGSRVLRLSLDDGETEVEELWAHQRMRIHIGNALRVGDVVWGANGDFGAVPFTGVNIETGEIVHRTRDIARAFQVLADGKLVILDEDGLLTLATPKSNGLDINATHQLFDTRAWTPPTLIGRTLYARDQQKLVALELP